VPASRLSATRAFLYFAFGAWLFALFGIALGCVSGGIDTGPAEAALWRKAAFVSLLALGVAIPAIVCGAIYAGWLRVRHFATRWRQARVVPLSAGFFTWLLVIALNAPVYVWFGERTDPTGRFIANYAYLVVIPLVPIVLAEASFRLFRSIEADIPPGSQREELP